MRIGMLKWKAWDSDGKMVVCNRDNVNQVHQNRSLELEIFGSLIP